MSLVRGKDTDCLSKANFIAKVRDVANSANVADGTVQLPKFPQFLFSKKLLLCRVKSSKNLITF